MSINWNESSKRRLQIIQLVDDLICLEHQRIRYILKPHNDMYNWRDARKDGERARYIVRALRDKLPELDADMTRDRGDAKDYEDPNGCQYVIDWVAARRTSEDRVLASVLS